MEQKRQVRTESKVLERATRYEALEMARMRCDAHLHPQNIPPIKTANWGCRHVMHGVLLDQDGVQDLLVDHAHLYDVLDDQDFDQVDLL